MEEVKRPRVGVGVLILNEKNEVLMGLRKGSHGSGEWCFPGGHLEFGETVFETARREVKEETGLEVRNMELISIADEMKYIETDGKHYLNIGVKAEYVGGEPELLEPTKCLEWRWFNLHQLPSNILEGSDWTIENYLAKRLYKPARD